MLLALLRKEIRNLLRDRMLLGLVVMYPIVVLLLLPFATTTEIKQLGTVVIDQDRSSLSQQLSGQFFSSGYFVDAWQEPLPPTLSDAMTLVEHGQADLIVTIPRGFERDLMLARSARVEVRVNAFNATKGAMAGGYAQRIVQQYAERLTQDAGLRQVASIPVEVVEVPLFNPTANYKNYIIPGLVAILITLTSFILPALNMVQEKEIGTIEQMNVTPVHPLVFMLSKALPYNIISLLMVLLSLVIVGVTYGLSPVGSIWVLLVGSLGYTLAMSGLGLTITNFAETQQQAMFSFFFVMMFFILMGGLFTPIEGMPDWARALSMSHPFSYFIMLSRRVYLKEVGFAELWRELVVLWSFAVGFCSLAIITYRKRS